jgi:hypothetical protein
MVGNEGEIGGMGTTVALESILCVKGKSPSRGPSSNVRSGAEYMADEARQRQLPHSCTGHYIDEGGVMPAGSCTARGGNNR